MRLIPPAYSPFVDTATREAAYAEFPELARDPPPARQQAKQRLRIGRFAFASAFSLVYVLVLAAFFAHGKVDRATLLVATIVVVVLIGLFFAAFRSNLNLRFADPSLTGLQ